MAKSARLEVRQLCSSTAAAAANNTNPANAVDTVSADTFPVLLQLPINGRLTALEALTVPSLPTSAIFLLQDRHQYAVISYYPPSAKSLPTVATAPGQLPKVSPYPVYTHASGSLESGGDGVSPRPNESGTLVAVDPNFRCIALHCFEGLLTVLPIDPNYTPPSATTDTAANPKDDRQQHQQQQRAGGEGRSANPRRPKQLLGAPFHCRMEENTILAITFLHTMASADASNNNSSGSSRSSRNSSDPPPPLQLAVLYQDARGSQHVTTHVINLQKQQMHLYGSQFVPTPVQWLKKSAIDGGSSMLIPVKMPAAVAAAGYNPHPDQQQQQQQQPIVGNDSNNANMPGPAVIVIGQRQFTYCSTTTTKIIPVPQALFLAYTELPCDPASGMPRYLLADELGNLHMLSIMTVKSSSCNDPAAGRVVVVALQLETLGSCTLATTLAYLREGLLYVGSALGDSQLVQIHDEPIIPFINAPLLDGGGEAAENAATGDGREGTDVLLDTTYLSVVEEYTNLGPILDFDLVPTTPGGAAAPNNMASSGGEGPSSSSQQRLPQIVQSQVVTASGSSKSGSIRVVRNGIGMNEYAAVEIPGIQAMWSLRKSYEAQEDVYLVQSFVGETRVLGVIASGSGSDDDDDNNAMQDGTEKDEEEAAGGTLAEVVLPGLESAASTLYVGNVQAGDRVLQITDSEVRLFAWSGEIVSNWAGQITVASANEAGQIVVALQGGMLAYLAIEGDQIQKIHDKQMDREVSCIDIHPFAAVDLGESGASAMDVDYEVEYKRVAYKSSMIAVGLWDDFTVRLLSINSGLEELVCINLGSSEDDEEVEEQAGSGLSRRNRNNMMARSLSLITLDFSSSAGGSGKNGSSGPGVNMLFVGLGDGTLISFAVVLNKGVVSVQSKKEVCLGTQRIDLVPLNTEQGGTCVLATGDRPTVIYLAGVGGTANQSNPKLCYSNVNVAASDDEEVDDVSRLSSQQSIAVNVAAPFFSPLLFDAAALGKQHYSLCVADDTSLRLGVIDDIQKLHVTTCRLGMAPRRIVHCPEGRLFAVGCIESGIQNFGLGGDEANMGNCIRFMDDTTFDDLERLDLEPYEMILSMAYVSLKTPPSAKDTADATSTGSSDLVFKPFLLVGTAYALPDEDEPTRGRILVYSCQADDAAGSSSNNPRAVRQITEFSAEGGVYSMCQFYEGKILVTVNSRTHICQLVEDTGLLRLQYQGLGHFGHILSLFVKSRAQPSSVESVSRVAASGESLAMDRSSSQGSTGRKENKEPNEMLAIVGDLMRSISLVQYYPQHQTLEEVARDFNTNWTCAVEMLNDNVYLGAENWHNLFCLRRNTASASEEIRCRLDTIGEFHLGEMCNKFMAGSLVMPASSNSTTSNRRHVRRGTSPQKKRGSDVSPSKAISAAARIRRPIVSTGSQTLFGTVDGTLGVILGLDMRTTAFFSTLERAMANVIRHVGDFGHQHYRACHAERRIHPAHGFIDGDLVEGFLDLDRTTMDAVVTEMNRDGGWDFDDAVVRTREDRKDKSGEQEENAAVSDDEEDRPELSVDDVLAMVEEMTMLH